MATTAGGAVATGAVAAGDGFAVAIGAMGDVMSVAGASVYGSAFGCNGSLARPATAAWPVSSPRMPEFKVCVVQSVPDNQQ
ncbi:hypothetical protein A8146_10915 [Mesorhizobium loti]|nr:hypothetical protein A8146_10915 [Mesorhizobium loti]